MSIEKMRKDIDEIDEGLIMLLYERAKIAKEIAKLKSKRDLPMRDDDREKEVIENSKRLAKGKLDEEFVEGLMKLVLEYSKKIQSK